MTMVCRILLTFEYLVIILLVLVASFTSIHCASNGDIVSDDSRSSKMENAESKQIAAQTHNDSIHKAVAGSTTKPLEMTGEKPMITSESIVKENSKVNLNCSLPENKNNTFCKDNSFVSDKYDNSGMLIRTMLVLLGVTSIVIIYFVVRAVRLRRRRSKSRKYGVITRGSAGGEMEMEPLGDGDDEDDDYNHR